MAEIDYAFIAEFAKVDPTSGTLTVVGASWTYLTTPQVPCAYALSVAGRIRSSVEEEEVELSVTFAGPEDVVQIESSGNVGPGGTRRPYGDGRLGLLWALNMQVVLPVEGLYTVDVTLPKYSQTRRLAFEVARQEPNQKSDA